MQFNRANARQVPGNQHIEENVGITASKEYETFSSKWPAGDWTRSLITTRGKERNVFPGKAETTHLFQKAKHMGVGFTPLGPGSHPGAANLGCCIQSGPGFHPQRLLSGKRWEGTIRRKRRCLALLHRDCCTIGSSSRWHEACLMWEDEPLSHNLLLPPLGKG